MRWRVHDCVIAAQLLSLVFRDLIPGQRKQDSILLVRRSSKRYFRCHSKIVAMLEQVAAQYKLQVEVYPDNPAPDFTRTAGIVSDASHHWLVHLSLY